MTSRGTALVTGGGGFLGSRLVPKLVNDGWNVRCVVRSADSAHTLRLALTPAERDCVEIEVIELTSVRSCRAAMRNCSTVIHAAAAGTGSAAALFADTVATTRRLVDACVQTGSRLVLVSSFSVYRTDHLRRGDVLDEQCELEPRPELRDPYAFSKLVQERVCTEAAEQQGLSLFITRPSVIYGPGRGLLSSRVGLQIAGRLFRFGTWHSLPYVYVDNCADGIVAAARLSSSSDVVNLVDDELPSPRAITKALSGMHNGPPVVSVPLVGVKLGVNAFARLARWSDGMLPPALTPYKASAQWKPLTYANAKAKLVLGWVPAVGLNEAIAATVAWSNSQLRRGA